MPAEAYALVRETLERFARGDREYWRSVFAEDIEWDMTGDDSGMFGAYSGREGVEQFFIEWLGAWEDYSVENTEYIDAGNSVVVVFRQSGRGKGSGIETDREFFGVYDVRGGQITRYRAFSNREEALRAAGLSSEARP